MVFYEIVLQIFINAVVFRSAFRDSALCSLPLAVSREGEKKLGGIYQQPTETETYNYPQE